MRGVVASVTSCIGGKDERYAVKIKPQEDELYFVYKTMSEFEALWVKVEAIAEEAKLKQQLFVDDSASQDVSVFAKWLMSFVGHFAFRTTIEQLREQDKETITPLNILLQALVRRVSALYVESTILRCGCCQVGRQLALLVRTFLEFSEREKRATKVMVMFESPRQRKRQQSEINPADDDSRKRAMVMPMFPVRPAPEGPSLKARKLSVVSSESFSGPMIRKVELGAPAATTLTGRRRVYAEVDF